VVGVYILLGRSPPRKKEGKKRKGKKKLTRGREGGGGASDRQAVCGLPSKLSPRSVGAAMEKKKKERKEGEHKPGKTFGHRCPP